MVMKRYVALLLLSGFSKISGAEEFKLEFSKDFVDTDSQSLEEASGAQPVKNPAKENNAAPTEVAPAKAADNKAAKPEAGQTKPAAEPRPAESSDSGLPPPRLPQAQATQGFGRMPNQAANSQGLGLLFVDPDGDDQALPGQGVADPFTQMRDDLRLMVGDEMYSRMVWSYWDVKQLDNLIYAEMSQYDLLVQQWLADAQDIFGLNDQLRANLVLPGTTDSEAGRLRLASLNRQHAHLQQTLSAGLSADKLDQVRMTGFDNQSLFFMFYQYLTFRNFFYMISSLLGFVYVARLFKFLLRQQ